RTGWIGARILAPAPGYSPHSGGCCFAESPQWRLRAVSEFRRTVVTSPPRPHQTAISLEGKRGLITILNPVDVEECTMKRQAILGASRSILGLAVVLLNMTRVPAQSSEKTKKPQRPSVGDQAPDFELSSIDDKTAKLSSLTEEGPVVLVVLRGYPG